MTTNRVGTIDEAFKSRIHLSLLYPALNLDQTIAIWLKHLRHVRDNLPNIIVDDNEILVFANQQWKIQIDSHKVGWNGRQIRNAFQTAVALAEYESIGKSAVDGKAVRPELRRQFFETVQKASIDFDNYLQLVLTVKQTEYVKNQRWRNDTGDAPGQMNNSRPGWGSQQSRVPGFGGPNLGFGQNPQVQGGFNQSFQGQNAMGDMTQGYGQSGMGMGGQNNMMPNMQAPYGQQMAGQYPQDSNQQALGMNQMPNQGQQGMSMNSVPNQGQQSIGMNSMPNQGQQGSMNPGQQDTSSSAAMTGTQASTPHNSQFTPLGMSGMGLGVNHGF